MEGKSLANNTSDFQVPWGKIAVGAGIGAGILTLAAGVTLYALSKSEETTSSKKPKTNIDVNSSSEHSNKSSGLTENAMKSLDDVTGLPKVKELVKKRVSIIKYYQMREAQGIPTKQSMQLHLLLTGNPGTGKTTVARILGDIYKDLGVISPDAKFVEVDRSNLVGQYIGQTSDITRRKIEEAKGGILFIDEAYTLVSDRCKNDFGKEALEVIMKAMVDASSKLVVFAAGYPDKMCEFLEANPGLASRFGLRADASGSLYNSIVNDQLYFEDYQPHQLTCIFKLICRKNHFQFTNDFLAKLEEIFHFLYQNRGNNFGNGRDVRNIFNQCEENLANRIQLEFQLATAQSISKEQLITFDVSDLPQI